jgi:hypothetical protein
VLAVLAGQRLLQAQKAHRVQFPLLAEQLPLVVDMVAHKIIQRVILMPVVLVVLVVVLLVVLVLLQAVLPHHLPKVTMVVQVFKGLILVQVAAVDQVQLELMAQALLAEMVELEPHLL